MIRHSVGMILAGVIVLSVCMQAQANLSVDLDTIVVTNSRSEQKDYRIASNVTVISREQIAASNARSIPDILRSAQGVNVYDNSTNKTAVVDIRGFGDSASRNVLILINGRKINSIDISGPDLEQIPVGAVERIEIIRGAGSVLYGDNAVGGVVNIITKKGKGNLQGRAGIVYGSYDSLDEHTEISGAHKNLSYFFYSRYLDQKGYRVNSQELAKDFNARVEYKFSSSFSTDLDMGWHKDDSGLPGGLLGSDLARLGRRASTNLEDYSSTKDRYMKLGLNAKPWVEDVYLGNILLDFLYRNRDTFDAFNSYGPFHTKRSIDTYGLTGKYVFDRTIFGKEVNFVTGIDYYDHSNDIVGSGDNVDDITIKKRELGAYDFLQYELLDKLYLSAGTRYNRADYEFHQRNVVVSASQAPDKWVNSGGLKYEYAKGSNVHFGWQQTFRFLSTDEWYSTANFPAFGITPGLNLDLKQQHGVQYEAGIKHNFSDAVIVGVTPYLLINSNEIFFDPVIFGNRNYDKTRRAGIDFDQRIDLLKLIDISYLDELDLVTSYTYQNAYFDKGANDGKEIPMVPMHAASQTVSARFLKYYELSCIGKFVGSRFAINDVQNTTGRIKPHEIIDGKIAYKRNNYEVYFAINNIFDIKYFSYVSKSTYSDAKSYFPAPERNFNVGVDLKF